MFLRSLLFCLSLAAFAQPPLPSTWEGQASGHIRGTAFRLPITIEFSAPLAHEQNPFHLALTTAGMKSIGDLLLASATSVTTGSSPMNWKQGGHIGVYSERKTRHGSFKPVPGSGVTLQYFTVTRQGPNITAELTETNAAAAASLNGFTGPNISVREASEVMRGVMASLGETEMFVFRKGVIVRLRLEGDRLTGSVEGTGVSVTNTTSDVRYTCLLEARRAKGQ